MNLPNNIAMQSVEWIHEDRWKKDIQPKQMQRILSQRYFSCFSLQPKLTASFCEKRHPSAHKAYTDINKRKYDIIRYHFIQFSIIKQMKKDYLNKIDSLESKVKRPLIRQMQQIANQRSPHFQQLKRNLHKYYAGLPKQRKSTSLPKPLIINEVFIPKQKQKIRCFQDYFQKACQYSYDLQRYFRQQKWELQIEGKLQQIPDYLSRVSAFYGLAINFFNRHFELEYYCYQSHKLKQILSEFSIKIKKQFIQIREKESERRNKAIEKEKQDENSINSLGNVLEIIVQKKYKTTQEQLSKKCKKNSGTSIA